MGKYKVGERIRTARKEAGIKMESLAKSAKIALSALSYWERGQKLPGIEPLASIADLLGVSVDWILGRDVDVKTNSQDVKDVLKAWDKCDSQNRQAVLAIAKALARQKR